MRAAMLSHQNESLVIAGRNLFDDEASSSNNTGAKLPTPPKTLHEHSRPNSSGLRNEDPLHHVNHHLSIVDNIQADEATRDTSRLRFFHFSLKGKAAEWLDRILPTQIMTWDQLVKLDQFTQFRFSSLTEEEGWNRIEEYVQYQDDQWDEPSPSMNVSSISEAMQPTLRGRLKRVCNQITNEAGVKWYTFKPEQNNLGDTYNPSWRSHPNLRRMVEFLKAMPINLKSNMWESEDLIKKPINWDKPPKNGDGAWHAKIRLIDPDGEEFTKTLQSIPTTRKLSERESPREIIDLDHFYDTKAHLLEDKQIPSVGVFDEVFNIWKAFGGNTRDLGSFGEETDKTTNLHQHLSRISTQKLETASQITHDAVTTHLKTASQDLQTASDCTTQPII
ncbi:hypothetical protein Tco_0823129 [Tanacetum coccineum]|uniref:Retrotransposon gag domain-containing protein n=1 Tax=Tanacetum coccineum TaxID=301880 RepID=A0ABQ5AH13_9ASTR